jgi:hypothetical protein
MTCLRLHKAHVLKVVSLLITIFAIMIALAAPAQLRGRGQPFTKPPVVPTSQNASPPLFLPAVTYGSGGGGAQSLAVADVNGDGVPDLAIANIYSNTLGILLGNSDGTFQAAATYGSGGYGTASVAVADVDGDGRPDLLVANECAIPISSGVCYSNGSVGVLLGNGDGTFQTALSYDPGRPVSNSIAVADFNGDGNPDVVVGNFNDSVGILLGNGDGTFQLGAIYSSQAEFSVAVADVNGDRKPDLLVANLYNDVAMLLGNGDGTFQPAVVYNPGGFDASSIVAHDVNGDGKPDLLITNWFVNNQDFKADGVVGVLLGNGDGTFKPAVTYDSGGLQPSSIAVADMNGDGKPDLLVGNCTFSGGSVNCTTGNGAVDVLLGNGNGTFQPAATYSSGGSAPTSVAIADVNGDGKPDLLVVNLCANSCPDASGSVGVLLNNTADTTPPVITLFATAKVLRSSKGKIVQIKVSGTITDTGSGVNVNSAAFAVKNEDGGVQQTGAIALDSGGNYSFTVLLPTSRRGSDQDGRRYAVTVRAKDNAGNRGSKTRVVTLPHDHGDEDDENESR